MVPVPLPHGFRFNPTDEELIQVLHRKVSGQEMPLHFILETNVYEHEPQDLEWNYTHAVSSNERYYYCKKEINHSREVNGRGWWKATSHVKKINDSNDQLVGHKRPLTFHRFKSEDRNRNNAVKTNSIMHEYSLESRATEWRLCKIKYKGKPSMQEAMENLRQNHSPRNYDVEATAGGSTAASLTSTDQLDSGSEQQQEDPVLPTLMPIEDDGYQQPYCQLNMLELITPAELASYDPYDVPSYSKNAAGYHFQQQEQVEAIDEQAFSSLWSWQTH